MNAARIYKINETPEKGLSATGTWSLESETMGSPH